MGEWLAAALLVSAFYLEPLAGNAPWSAALVVTCLAGAALLVTKRETIRRIPLVLVAFIALYALSGLIAGHGSGSDVARYLVRPAALVALSLFLTTPDSRRRVLVLLGLLTLPQLAFQAVQTIDAHIDYGDNAGIAADSVTGTFGAYGGGPAGLVAGAVLCVIAGLVLTRLISLRTALLLTVPLLLIEILTATRAAIVFLPLALATLFAAALLVNRRPSQRPLLGAVLAVAVLAAPLVYAGTIAVYPRSFVGVFSNQSSGFLGSGAPPPPTVPTGQPGQPAPAYTGPRGVQVLPGRFSQMKNAAKISDDDGAKVLLLGRGYGVAEIDNNATVFTYLPPERRVGVTWIGKVLTETGWLGLLAFVGLCAWLAWIGLLLARRASGWDRALGYALPGIAALTLIGATYTTVLDVRPYSAAFIVLAAAGVAAARDLRFSEDPGPDGNGRRARPSTPLPPRQQETSTAPSA